MKQGILVIALECIVAAAGSYRVGATIYRIKRVFVYSVLAAWIYMCRRALGFSTLTVWCQEFLDTLCSSPNACYVLTGAHFGTTFPHLLVKTYTGLVPDSPDKTYTGRLFGFRVNERSEAGPRMQWLRLKPPKEAFQNRNFQTLTDSSASQQSRGRREAKLAEPSDIFEGMEGIQEDLSESDEEDEVNA